ncbi:MAG TPA: HAD-IA family hydrolase [Candidatus Omnitrophota bacterium]|nr:HAD-IA family hydrolase [Candidatus Omnitrophota bacterium]
MPVSLLPYRFVIFDLDGVLVDSFQCWWRLLNATLEAHGKRPLTQEEFAVCWGQDVEADRRRFFPDWTVEGLIEHYTREFPRYAEWIQPMEGAQETLAGLERAGKRIAVASNSPMAMVERLLELASLRRHVSWAAGVDLVANGKPEPDLIEHVLREAGASREEACYVGDSDFDAQAARAADVYFIGYRRPGDARIESLGELIAR